LAAADNATRIVLPEIDELIWGGLAFAVVLLLLSRVAFPALRKGLEARQNAIRDELERAEQARLEAEQRREEYEGRLAQARQEADRIIAEATEAAESVRRERTTKAEEEARQIVEKARADAAGERDRAFAELRSSLADISIEAASRVLGKELSDPQSQRQLVEQFISETSRTRASTAAPGNGQRG
jgi:F-type H+-transporting ATPase subunit b